MASSTILGRIAGVATATAPKGPAFKAHQATQARCIHQLREIPQISIRGRQFRAPVATSKSNYNHIASSVPRTVRAYRARRLHVTSRRTQSQSGLSEGVQPPEYLTEGERSIFDKLKAELEPSRLDVQDISGGCGSMYGIDIVSKKFTGLTMIKQHRLVNQILGDDIKQWHGLQLKTKGE